jgi:general transcription factor 3C polypeptide 5 (transcription factor C subunit 1)
LQAHNSHSNKLELRFRPDDPYSHPAFGELRPCNNLLLKISKKMSNGDDGHICADIVARVPEGYHFEGMADYQHVVAVHADAAKQRKKRKRQWGEIEDPHFGQPHYISHIYT